MSWNDLDDIEEKRMEREVTQSRNLREADSVAIVSGGLDSTVLVYDMLNAGLIPHMLSFNYGQRHKKELTFAKKTATKLGLRHDIVDLSGLTKLISNSALTSDHKHAEGNDIIEVPDGHYAEDNMKATVVPNRNMIMLSIAAGVAVNNSYKVVATGVHGGDHFIYPDCRPRFINAANAAVSLGNAGFGAFPNVEENEHPVEVLHAPFLWKTKADIAYRALELGVPFNETWSCYKGGDIHCGKCGTCVERLEAIDEAHQKWMQNQRDNGTMVIGVTSFDQTEYEDTEFWKQAIENAIVKELSE